jgi:hypothetical protein
LISLDGGSTWDLLASQSGSEYDLVLPESTTEQAMLEIVAHDAGRTVGSWLSARFAINGGVTGVPGGVPRVFSVRFAGQNPVRSGSARLVLALPQRGDVDVAVYDVRGAVVRTLARGNFEAGNHSIEWDGRDSGGEAVGSGIYFVKAASGRQSGVVRVAYIH